MYARVTLLEIDTVRVDMDQALEMYKREVVPQLRVMPGFAGVVVMTTPDGKGLVETFWETAEAADASGRTGFYPELLEHYVMLFRSPPGRERYEVSYTELTGFDDLAVTSSPTSTVPT